jgi:transcriptional regulator with XRE-family HTH domain
MTEQNRTRLSQLRTTREARGLTLRELAHFAGCAHTTIARLEKGEIDVSVALKTRLAHALGVSVQELWPLPASPDEGSRA